MTGAGAVVFLVVLPQALSTFQINLLGRFLTYAIVALGLDLIWGYTGMLSLGQGLFFGIGAYCFAMYLNLETAGKNLPEFMGLYGVTELPWLWQPFQSPVIAILLAFVAPMLLAVILGYMIFRSRVQGVYFSIITQAFTAIVALLVVGLIGALELVADKKTRRAFDPKKTVGATCVNFLQELGLINRAMGDSVAFCPPLIITTEDIHEMFDMVAAAMDQTEAWVRKEGLRQ